MTPDERADRPAIWWVALDALAAGTLSIAVMLTITELALHATGLPSLPDVTPANLVGVAGASLGAAGTVRTITGQSVWLRGLTTGLTVGLLVALICAAVAI